MIGRPATSSNGFGVSAVRAPIRVPRPAASSTAPFMERTIVGEDYGGKSRLNVEIAKSAEKAGLPGIQQGSDGLVQALSVPARPDALFPF